MKPGDEVPDGKGGWMVVLSAEDYEAILTSAEADGDLDWCEVCGAWLTLDDPARATAEDFNGCWKAATGDGDLCRSYRASDAVNAIRRRRRMQERLDAGRRTEESPQ